MKQGGLRVMFGGFLWKISEKLCTFQALFLECFLKRCHFLHMICLFQSCFFVRVFNIIRMGLACLLLLKMTAIFL